MRAQELKVRAQGLGPLLSSLGDEVLVHALLFLLGGADLARCVDAFDLAPRRSFHLLTR